MTLLFVLSSLLILLVVRRLKRLGRQQDPTPGGPGQEPSDEEEGLLNEPLGDFEGFTPISEDPPAFSAVSPRTHRGPFERGRTATKFSPSTAFKRLSGGREDVKEIGGGVDASH